MAAVTVAVGAATLLAYSQAAQGDAALASGAINAQNSEYNAELAKERSAEDERKFRLAYQRDNAQNVANIGASGIKLEGSPLEVLQNNAANMEKDATAIKMGGVNEAEQYRRQAAYQRFAAKAGAQASGVSAAASALQGGGQAYGVYNKTSSGTKGG